jgi:hypothetical protein
VEKEKILNLIEKKIQEHNQEIKQSQEKLKELQEVMKNRKPELISLQELAVIKDKILFHKSSSMVLVDLKKEIEHVHSS